MGRGRKSADAATRSKLAISQMFASTPPLISRVKKIFRRQPIHYAKPWKPTGPTVSKVKCTGGPWPIYFQAPMMPRFGNGANPLGR